MKSVSISREHLSRRRLEEGIKLLQSGNILDRCEGLLAAAYSIEQVLKLALLRINPLLYFESRGLSDDIVMKLAMKKFHGANFHKIRTVRMVTCLNYICDSDPELKAGRANLDELFEIRNYILHSTHDINIHPDSISETAVSALRLCKKYFAEFLQSKQDQFNPLTAKEFVNLQRDEHRKRTRKLIDLLGVHKEIYKGLSKNEIEKRLTSEPKGDRSWIEFTFDCPACGREALDLIGSVDFDWSPDGVLANAGYAYVCRVCELELTPYEYEIVMRGLEAKYESMYHATLD